MVFKNMIGFFPGKSILLLCVIYFLKRCTRLAIFVIVLDIQVFLVALLDETFVSVWTNYNLVLFGIYY